MTWSLFLHALKHTCNDLKENPFILTAATLAFTCCLLILSFSWIAHTSLRNHFLTMTSEGRALIYLHEKLGHQERELVVSEIRKWPEIVRIQTTFRNDAQSGKSSGEKDYSGNVFLGAGIDGLSADIEIRFRPVEPSSGEIDATLVKLRQLPQVAEVFDAGILRERIEPIRSVYDLTGEGVIAVSALLAVLIPSLFTCLSLATQRQELEVAELLGAARLQSRLPFYFETITLGILASILCNAAILYLLWQAGVLFPGGNPRLIRWSVSETLFLTAGITLCGIALSWFGCWLSLTDNSLRRT